MKRDGGRCKWPGCRKRTGLEVHHLIPVEDAPHLENVDSNLLTLCHTHHLEAARLYAEAKAKRDANRRRRRSIPTGTHA